MTPTSLEIAKWNIKKYNFFQENKQEKIHTIHKKVTRDDIFP